MRIAKKMKQKKKEICSLGNAFNPCWDMPEEPEAVFDDGVKELLNALSNTKVLIEDKPAFSIIWDILEKLEKRTRFK